MDKFTLININRLRIKVFELFAGSPNLIKRFLLSLLAALALTTAVNAEKIFFAYGTFFLRTS